MHIRSSLSYGCVCGWACLHASPSAEQCVPLDPDKPRFASRSPDGLCPDQAPTEHPSSFVCCTWLTFGSKPFLVDPVDFRNVGFCPTCSSGPVHSLGRLSKRPSVARTSYSRPKARSVGSLAILRESANVYVSLLGPQSGAGNLWPVKPHILSES